MSSGDVASRFARFAFRRHFFQHLGFRLVQSVADSPPVRLVGTTVFVLGVGVQGKRFLLSGFAQCLVSYYGFDYFTLLFCRGRQKNVPNFKSTCRAIVSDH